jgi:hypothetical protein
VYVRCALSVSNVIKWVDTDDVARLNKEIEKRDAKILKLEEELTSYKKRETRLQKRLTQETCDKQQVTRRARELDTHLRTQDALVCLLLSHPSINLIARLAPADCLECMLTQLDQKTKEFQALLHDDARLREQLEQLSSDMYDEQRRSGVRMYPPLGDDGDVLSPLEETTPQQTRTHHSQHDRKGSGDESPFLPFAMRSQSPTSPDVAVRDVDVRKSLEKELSGLHADMGRLETELQKETELQRLTEERAKRINDLRSTESKIMDEIMAHQQRIRSAENRIELTGSPSSSHPRAEDDLSPEEIAEMKEENENLKRKLADLEENHRSVADEIHNLTVENERLRTAGEKIASRRPALENRERRLTERVKELETLLQEKDFAASLSESRLLESEHSFENGERTAFVEAISAFHESVSFNEIFAYDEQQDFEGLSTEEARSTFVNSLDQLSTYVARLRIDLDAALHASLEFGDSTAVSDPKEDEHNTANVVEHHLAMSTIASQTDLPPLPIPMDRDTRDEQKELTTSLEKKNRELALTIDDERRIISSKDALLQEYKRRCEKLQKRLDELEKEKSSSKTTVEEGKHDSDGTGDLFVSSFNAKTLREVQELRTQVRGLTEENQLVSSKHRELEDELSSLRRDHLVSMQEKDNHIQSLEEQCEVLRMQAEDVKSDMALRVDEPTTEEMLANISDEDDSALLPDDDESSKLRQLHLHDIPFSHEEIGGPERSNVIYLQSRARLLLVCCFSFPFSIQITFHNITSFFL